MKRSENILEENLMISWLSRLKERQISQVIPSFLFADSQVKRVPCAELRDAGRREDHELISGPLKFE